MNKRISTTSSSFITVNCNIKLYELFKWIEPQSIHVLNVINPSEFRLHPLYCFRFLQMMDAKSQLISIMRKINVHESHSPCTLHIDAHICTHIMFDVHVIERKTGVRWMNSMFKVEIVFIKDEGRKIGEGEHYFYIPTSIIVIDFDFYYWIT